MSAPAPDIRGWCPGALRPMASGDGLVVRIRPPGGRLSPDQARAIAGAAERYGNGRIDLSARANLQIRGVSPENHPALLAALAPAGLIDRDIAAETRRNILVSPFADPETDRLAALMETALAELPRLPSKFGFAVDCGPLRCLAGASADIRLERAISGGLILRAEGSATGAAVTADGLEGQILSLARWFRDSGGAAEGPDGTLRGRMGRHLGRAGTELPPALAGTLRPVPAAAPPRPGLCSAGALLAVRLGSFDAQALHALAGTGFAIRLTPWRMLLLCGAESLPDLSGLTGELTGDPADPLLRVVACSGAPLCPQAHADTRALARRLAAHVPENSLLHISGCPKGCAHPAPAPNVLTATPEGFHLIRNGRACDPPPDPPLTPEALAAPGFTFSPASAEPKTNAP